MERQLVHALKDSSVIADKIQVDDKLCAVDDEDVRSMTAIKVNNACLSLSI
jgi:PDZ domain-containing secreted protein